MILGLVLAGGRSSRFGSDKARALLEGRPLIDHAVALLRPHVAALAIAGGDAEPALPIVRDQPHPGLGPLGGIAGGLAYARAAGFSHLLSLPCDTPLLPPGLLATLAEEEAPAALRGLPVCGLWPAALGPALVARLTADGDRSMRAWMRAIGGRWIDHPPIANVNTPADLAALAR